MTNVAVWEMADSEPRRLVASSVDLEARLEEWIEQDPDLVEFGLTIVGRQVSVEAGFIDLLATDPQGRWFIIEIKRGNVDRHTVGQVLDYAACWNGLSEQQLRATLQPHLERRNLDLEGILGEADALDSLSPGERDIVLVVVGTGQASGLDRMLSFLAERYSVPVVAKLFNVFETSRGEQLLVREVAEGEGAATKGEIRQSSTEAEVRAVAERAGLADVFDTVAAAAERHGLGTRVWKRSVMFTPPSNRTRVLFTVWTSPVSGGLRMWVEPKGFAEFYGVTAEEAHDVLGGSGYRVIGINEARDFAKRLDHLFAQSGPSGV